jgi:dihydroorotate dehydrogenase (fumarate)
MTSIFPDVEIKGPVDYLNKIAKLVDSVQIPIIGSINAVNCETWVDYAIQMEKTGVAALELNFYTLPSTHNKTGQSMERELLNTLQAIRSNVKIPISVKLSPFYTNPLNLIKQMDSIGIDGIVMFNQLFQPDIDLDTGEEKFNIQLSTPKDVRLPLRFTGLLHGQINGDICASGGIFNGIDALKLISTGATTIQTVSGIYKSGPQHVDRLNKEISLWLTQHDIASINDIRGRYGKNQQSDPWAFTRSQYIKQLMKSNPLTS